MTPRQPRLPGEDFRLVILTEREEEVIECFGKLSPDLQAVFMAALSEMALQAIDATPAPRPKRKRAA